MKKAAIGVTSVLTVAMIFLCAQLMSLKNQVRHLAMAKPQVVECKEHINQEAALRLLKSTVRVSRQTDGARGSGVIFASVPKSFGYMNFLFTCAHVVGKTTTMMVEEFVYDNGRTILLNQIHMANVVYVNEEKDIAVITYETESKPEVVAEFVTPEEFNDLKIYDQIYVVGCPLGANPVVTGGNIGGFDAEIGPLFVTASVIFGNSGGPVFTKSGKLLGITKMILAQGKHVFYEHGGLAVPAPELAGILEVAGLGFLIGEKDGSNLTKFLKDYEDQKEALRAQEEAEELFKETLKQRMEDFMQKLKPIDPAKEPK